MVQTGYPSDVWIVSLLFSNVNGYLGRNQTNEHAVAGLNVEEHPIGTVPFGLKETPVSLRVDARKLPAWRAIDGVADPVPESPTASSQANEQITLVPYAAAKLGITAFPELDS